jgi:hypothetical protein
MNLKPMLASVASLGQAYRVFIPSKCVRQIAHPPNQNKGVRYYNMLPIRIKLYVEFESSIMRVVFFFSGSIMREVVPRPKRFYVSFARQH